MGKEGAEKESSAKRKKIFRNCGEKKVFLILRGNPCGGEQWRFFFFFRLSGKRKNGGGPGGVCTLPKGGKKYFGTELRIFPQEEVKTSNLGNEKDDRFHLNASPNAISK